MTAPTLREWFMAYRDACHAECEAAQNRVLEPRIETRNAHRVATVRRCELEARLDEAMRDAERQLAHCRARHVDTVAPFVSGQPLPISSSS